MIFELRRVDVGGPIQQEKGKDALPVNGHLSIGQVRAVFPVQEGDRPPELRPQRHLVPDRIEVGDDNTLPSAPTRGGNS
jgi:hypothetical protein